MPSNHRSKESHRSRVGASLNDETRRFKQGLQAAAELATFKAPKPMSHWHHHNVCEARASGQSAIESRHVLMDYERGVQLKAKMMTRLEAWRRNETLRGTGFAWALCSK